MSKASYFRSFPRSKRLLPILITGIQQSLAAGVVRSFGSHDDVMRMGFAQASVGDTDETATFRHFGDVVSADVEHGLVQATDHLVQHCVQRSAVRHFAFNAFRNDLVVGGDVGLEVAILGVGLLAKILDRKSVV